MAFASRASLPSAILRDTLAAPDCLKLETRSCPARASPLSSAPVPKRSSSRRSRMRLPLAALAPSLILTGQHPGLVLGEHGLGGYIATRLALPWPGRPARPCPHRRRGRRQAAADSARPPRRPGRYVERAWAARSPQSRPACPSPMSKPACAASIPPCRGPRKTIASPSTPLPTFCSPRPKPAPPTSAAKASAAPSMSPATAASTRCSPHWQRCRAPRPRDAAKPPLILVTCHRRENWGVGLTSVALALIEIARSTRARIDCVLHPNPAVRKSMHLLLDSEPGIRLVEPYSHRAMIAAMRDCRPHPQRFRRRPGRSPRARRSVAGPARKDRASRRRRQRQHGAGRHRHRAHRRARSPACSPIPTALAAMARPALPFGDGRAGPRIAGHMLDWLAARGEDAARRRA